MTTSMNQKARRYNRRSLTSVIAELKAWMTQVENTINNMESSESVNEERLNTLQNRLDSLSEAVEALEGIE